jgi:uncharacterized protein with von Willebrand factor type A (vWA) domain
MPQTSSSEEPAHAYRHEFASCRFFSFTIRTTWMTRKIEKAGAMPAFSDVAVDAYFFAGAMASFTALAR